MKIKTKDGKNQLFVSVGRLWNNEGHVFKFLKQFEDKANDMIYGFGSYMIKYHGYAVLLCLTAEAGDRAMSLPWDPEKRCAISAGDNKLAKIDKSNNMSWLIETDKKWRAEKQQKHKMRI